MTDDSERVNLPVVLNMGALYQAFLTAIKSLMEDQYDVAGRINILRQGLTSDKNRVAFLLGAGCPLSIRNAADQPLISSIPEHVYEGMKIAESVGRYLNSEIKGHYRYARE